MSTAYATEKKEVMKLYRSLTKQLLHLQTMPMQQSNTYYEKRAAFTSDLECFIRTTGAMLLLSGKQVLTICSMVSTYRPMALHSFLIYCAKEIEG